MPKPPDFTILIVDEQIPDDDPLVTVAKNRYDSVVIKRDTKSAISFIKENIQSKIVVLLDLNLSDRDSGHETLRQIRELSNLIPVIIWSAVNERTEEFSDLINNKSFAFVSQTADLDDIIENIDRAIAERASQLDAAIEAWILQHSADDRARSYLITAEGKDFSLNDILSEIRRGTAEGAKFVQMFQKFAVELLIQKGPSQTL